MKQDDEAIHSVEAIVKELGLQHAILETVTGCGPDNSVTLLLRPSDRDLLLTLLMVDRYRLGLRIVRDDVESVWHRADKLLALYEKELKEIKDAK